MTNKPRRKKEWCLGCFRSAHPPFGYCRRRVEVKTGVFRYALEPEPAQAEVAREDGFLNDVRHLIVDRDPLYTEQLKTILTSGGIGLLKLPASSPNLNAYAERFVRAPARR